MDQHHEAAKHLLDALSLGVAFGTFVQLLPSIAAAFSILWTTVRFFESRTGQRVVGAVKRLLGKQKGEG